MEPSLPTLEEQVVTTPTEKDSSSGLSLSPPPATMAISDSSCSAATTWAELTHSFGDLELDRDQDGSAASASSITGCSFRSTPTPLSAPGSPFPSAYSNSTNYSITNSPSQSSSASFSHSQPGTPTRRRPLTTPLVRSRSPARSYTRRHPQRSLSQSSTGTSSSTSSMMMSLTLPPPPEPCPQVQKTLTLLKSIKQQIKGMKRRESRLSSKLYVQRRERQQMQEQIVQLEARRFRVEAMFLRPLPLILLLPVMGNEDEEYDLCLISEGSDSWNALPPLIRIQLIQTSNGGRTISSRSRGSALLVHFGPTLTQPMAAALSFIRNNPNSNDPMTSLGGNVSDLAHFDLQPLAQQRDVNFWERVTSGRVMEADRSNQLEESSCQFLFDALHRDLQHLWRHQLTQVVDKNTRRIQWILPQEAEDLYYEVIPAAGSSSHLALPPSTPHTVPALPPSTATLPALPPASAPLALPPIPPSLPLALPPIPQPQSPIMSLPKSLSPIPLPPPSPTSSRKSSSPSRPPLSPPSFPLASSLR
eukprot:Sro604_g174080.1 n/a (531) ;mRNA; r:9524-11116